MFRHSWAIAASLVTVFGFVTHAPAQTPAASSPSTAYRQNGKWVGYVPPHQKYSQPKTSRLFRSSLPDIGSFLAGRPDNQVRAATAVEPVRESARPFAGALLDSEEADAEPRVLAVAFDQPTPAFDPMADAGPVFDPATEMMGEACSTGCGPCAAAPTACCPPPRFYGTADYLLWWTEGMGSPPLATTSPVGTAQNQAGVLGQPGTTILFGGSELGGDAVSGGRFSVGMWLDPCQKRGVEASYFTLGTQSESFGASNADFAILARPFYNTVDGQQDARLIAYDGLVSGSLNATASTSFEGGELLFRQAMQRECWAEIDLVVGYRWLQLEEGLLIEESTRSLSGVAAGTSFDLFDRFDTRNSFHGGEVGMSLRRQIAPCWSVELLGKMAIGNVNSVVTVDGQTTTIAPTGTSVSQGGLLAQPTNMGRYERDKLATATELGLTLKRAFGNGIDLTVGYTFLYLSDVARPGDQIDPNINVSQLPPGPLAGAALPEFSFQSSGFWAQGLSFGIEGRF
jgi:putative beta barrel porin BBP7